MEEPPPITIKNPSSSSTMITGASQNFFRSFMNIHKSFSKSILTQFILELSSRACPEISNFKTPYHIKADCGSGLSAMTKLFLWLFSIFIKNNFFSPFRLIFLCENILTNYQIIHLCIHKTSVGIFR